MKRFLFCAVIISLLLSLVITAISCTKAKPTISYSPASFSFTATQGGDNPVIQAIGIWNSGGGTLDWSVSDDATWLNLSPTNGSSTGGTSNVIVSVDTAGLTAGNHNALITVSASSATNMPQTIPVTLVIASPPTPTPTATPTSSGTALDVALREVQNAVDTYAVQSGVWPTANGALPATGTYTLIDFNASFEKDGQIFSFYPHFISNLPRHSDEGVWRIDSAALVSIDMPSDEY